MSPRVDLVLRVVWASTIASYSSHYTMSDVGEDVKVDQEDTNTANLAVEPAEAKVDAASATSELPTSASTPSSAQLHTSTIPPVVQAQSDTTPITVETSDSTAKEVPLSVINTNSPAPRRPKPPTKGILKPPPPPAKPTLSNRLRDIVTVVGGGAKSLFELEETPGAGPSSSPAPATVGGTLNALSGRLGFGLSRFVSPVAAQTNGSTQAAGLSPVIRSVSLPENGGVSDRARQKQPLKRATFLLPSMSITYPISSSGEPWSQKVLDDRKRVCLRVCCVSPGWDS